MFNTCWAFRIILHVFFSLHTHRTDGLKDIELSASRGNHDHDFIRPDLLKAVRMMNFVVVAVVALQYPWMPRRASTLGLFKTPVATVSSHVISLLCRSVESSVKAV